MAKKIIYVPSGQCPLDSLVKLGDALLKENRPRIFMTPDVFGTMKMNSPIRQVLPHGLWRLFWPEKPQVYPETEIMIRYDPWKKKYRILRNTGTDWKFTTDSCFPKTTYILMAEEER